MVLLAKQIAEELGESWRGGPGNHDYDAFLTGPNDERLHLRDSNWRNRQPCRLYILGSLIHVRDNRVSGPPGGEISVRATRPAADIAREITRRLLPGYREALEENRRRQAAADAQEAACSQLERQLLAALPGARYLEHSRSIMSGSYGENQCDIDVRRGDYAKFEIHVPHSHAVVLARFVESLRKGSG